VEENGEKITYKYVKVKKNAMVEKGREKERKIMQK